MSKSHSQRAAVPAHLFESMLRSAMSGESVLQVWKDDLLHWDYSTAQLDQLILELKESSNKKEYKENAIDTIDFIETKIRNRKD